MEQTLYSCLIMNEWDWTIQGKWNKTHVMFPPGAGGNTFVVICGMLCPELEVEYRWLPEKNEYRVLQSEHMRWLHPEQIFHQKNNENKLRWHVRYDRAKEVLSYLEGQKIIAITFNESRDWIHALGVMKNSVKNIHNISLSQNKDTCFKSLAKWSEIEDTKDRYNRGYKIALKKAEKIASDFLKVTYNEIFFDFDKKKLNDISLFLSGNPMSDRAYLQVSDFLDQYRQANIKALRKFVQYEENEEDL